MHEPDLDPARQAVPPPRAPRRAGGAAQGEVGPALGAFEREALAELERLRAELSAERARGRARALELESVVRDLRRLLALPREEREAAPAASRPADSGAPWRAVVGLVAAAALGFVARPLVLGSARSVVHAGSVTELVARVPETPTASPASPAAASDVSSVVAPAAEDVATAPPDDPPRQPSGTGSGTHGDAEVAPAPSTPAKRTVAPALDRFAAAEFTGRLSAAAAAPLAYVPDEAPPCAFHDAARLGSELRAALGPCMGPPTRDGAAVAGTHRVDGVPCCKHHQLAQRLGGDHDELRGAAALARAEGALPPLVAARVDRAAALFLRARLGAWRASGVDDLAGEGHRVRLGDDGVAHVETWVELDLDGSPDATVERRRVTLALELSDGPSGDTLLSLACEPRVAASAPPVSTAALGTRD